MTIKVKTVLQLLVLIGFWTDDDQDEPLTFLGSVSTITVSPTRHRISSVPGELALAYECPRKCN